MGTPKIDPSAFVAPGAAVVGDVELAENTSVFYNAVVRGDGNRVIVGKNSNIQDCVVIHGEEDVIIGENVSIGHGAIIHGAKIQDNVLIGMGAIVMDGAVIGKNSIVAAGALIGHKKEIPPASLVMGVPGKVKREMTKEEIQGNLDNAVLYVAMAKKSRDGIWDKSPEAIRDEMIARGELQDLKAE